MKNFKFTLTTIVRLCQILFLTCSLGMIDVWLRIKTRTINLYHILEIEPNLFTLLWAILLTAIVLIPQSQKIGRFLYGIIYFFYLIFAIVQYGTYLILGRFLFVSDFLYAGEGTDYISYILDFISIKLIFQVLVLILIGVIGIYIFPKNTSKKHQNRIIYCISSILCLVLIPQVPKLYDSMNEHNWNAFSDPAFEYKYFVNSTFDMQLAGMYQYLAHDIEIQLNRIFTTNKEQLKEEIDAFFTEKQEHQDNSMTGLFEGKNLIVVMMESIDDWVITESDTPTLWYMSTHGINFTNMYTPQYSNGYTFNTEFAYSTSIYPFSNGNAAYMLSKNSFPNTLATKLKEQGYSVNSFHEGLSSFYNRGEMHKAFGYDKYYSYLEYPTSGDIAHDTYLTDTEPLYNEVVKSEPFYSFIITYSGHLPYTDDDALSKYALNTYPEYDVQENRELAILRAKAKITDTMFADLLNLLQKDGLLENTVIVAFTDHYAYGISDKEALQKISEESGSSILERTPAFIYCAGYENSLSVEKTMQITDLAPTLMNLFGIDVPKNIMGQDVFDDNNNGLAIFPNNTWITDTTYMKNGTIIWNYGMTEEEIKAMNEYVQQTYQINDAILECDYYK